MNVDQLCFHLRHRRRMYLLDDRFSTAVAFVEGYNLAFDEPPLAAFQRYVANRILGGGSNLHWAYVIASTTAPDSFDQQVAIDQLPVETNVQLIERMIVLLEEYQAQASRG